MGRQTQGAWKPSCRQYSPFLLPHDHHSLGGSELGGWPVLLLLRAGISLKAGTCLSIPLAGAWHVGRLSDGYRWNGFLCAAYWSS